MQDSSSTSDTLAFLNTLNSYESGSSGFLRFLRFTDSSNMLENSAAQSPTVSTKTPLRYPGGKTRAIKVLDELLPQDVNIKRVLAPFLGGGSYELHLTERGIQVEGHDVFQQLTNFWQYLLSSPAQLADAVNARRPVGSTKFKQYQNALSTTTRGTLEAAAEFFIVNRCSYSGATLSGGYSKASEDGRLTDSIIERVREFKNDLITVGNKSFEDTIKPGFDFIFADPPYLLPNTSSNKLYGVSGSLHDSFDHGAFAEAIKAIETPWLITYNDSVEIRKMYSEYRVDSVSWSYGMNKSKKSSEVVIRNY